jgi:hypothetical protein
MDSCLQEALKDGIPCCKSFVCGERKRLEKVGKTSKNGKEKASGELDDILVIEYTKRGSTREWDEGEKVPI